MSSPRSLPAPSTVTFTRFPALAQKFPSESSADTSMYAISLPSALTTDLSADTSRRAASPKLRVISSAMTLPPSS